MHNFATVLHCACALCLFAVIAQSPTTFCTAVHAAVHGSASDLVLLLPLLLLLLLFVLPKEMAELSDDLW